MKSKTNICFIDFNQKQNLSSSINSQQPSGKDKVNKHTQY